MKAKQSSGETQQRRGRPGGAGANNDAEIAADEIIIGGKVDGEARVRGVAKNIALDSFITDLSSMDSKRLSDQDCELLVRTDRRRPDTAGNVHASKADIDVGACGKYMVPRTTVARLRLSRP